MNAVSRETLARLKKLHPRMLKQIALSGHRNAVAANLADAAIAINLDDANAQKAKAAYLNK